MPCPSAQQPVNDGNLDFLPGYTEDFNVIVDHCNGLILYEEDLETAYVVYPATRQWDFVDCKDDVLRKAYLVVFDPAVSPHYELFFIPNVPEKAVLPEEEEDP
jgi:hypothetical protein